MRKPAVAGQFYPSKKDELLDMLKGFSNEVKQSQIGAIAGVSPHAGYIYSGKIATHTYKAMQTDERKTIAIIGPDHVGYASALGEIAIYSGDEWETPLGVVPSDDKVAKKIEKEIDIARIDNDAHIAEHSIEVQIPFIQYYMPNCKILPIMLGNQDYDVAITLGKALAKYDVIVIASSDMSHYIPVQAAVENDKYAIDALTKIDIKGFYNRIEERGVSACGYGAMAAAAQFAKEKGKKEGKLLAYGTSSDVTGDPVCVGYASIAF